MNIDPILLTVASLGFILGWLSGRRNQMKKVLYFIRTLEFSGKANNKDFEAGMLTGTRMMKDTIHQAIKDKSYLNGININVKGGADKEGNPKVDYKKNNKE